jgi:hypothetical protein
MGGSAGFFFAGAIARVRRSGRRELLECKFSTTPTDCEGRTTDSVQVNPSRSEAAGWEEGQGNLDRLEKAIVHVLVVGSNLVE